MPRGDRTGPLAYGPRTGRGLGFCSGFNSPGFTKPWGAGRGWGLGRGFGRGMGFRWRHFWSYVPDYPPMKMSPEDEKKVLEDQVKFLEQELEQVKSRLEQLNND